jgi:hypothetical protein
MTVMKSPFPGMDPYLEAHWLDVHTRLVTHAAESLNEQLPSGLIATTEERVAIEGDDELIRRFGPDVTVFAPASSSDTEGGIAIDAPFKVVLNVDPIIERFIRIYDANGERLITVVEFVSPTNKSRAGIEAYQRKRDELIAAGVHVVEIDLVRQGAWRQLLRPYICPRDAVATYRAAIFTATPERPVYLYPIRLSAPLPNVPVPLRPGDKLATLHLQQLIEHVYTRGRYSQRLDYSRPPDPPLEAEDTAWAADLLNRAGKP